MRSRSSDTESRPPASPLPTMAHRLFFHRATPLARAALLVALVVSWPGGNGRAEPPKPPEVRESAPEIYYMQDDAGRLVPVPGFRYRDFVDLLRIKEGLPGLPEPPAAVLENVVLRATVPSIRAADGDGSAAMRPTSCEATVELTVRQSRSGWVSLPISLEGLLLTSPPRHEGPGRMMLTADASADSRGDLADRPRPRGYRLWVNGPSDAAGEGTRHSVILVGTVAIEASPSHESLTLDLPRATASLVELTTSRIEPDVSVRPQSLPPRVEPREGKEGSMVMVVGLAGAATIRIGAGRNGGGAEAIGMDASRNAVPQSMVDSVVRVDGRVAITEASIRLDNLPPENGTIRVKLPPRATLRSIRSPSALVSLEGTDAQPEAVIRVDRGPDNRSQVDIECERPIDPTGREPFQPLGFSVENVPSWRQWGRTSIVVEGDWQVEWEEVLGNRRIDPPLSARRPGFVAAFAYDSQPARLPLRVLPRGSRVVIEPEYRYDVSATRVALDARLRVSVRGAPVPRIVVAIEDWDVDEVGPASLIDSAAVSSEGGRLVVPFVQPLSGDAVVEIRCGRGVEREGSRVGWRIPAPQADLVGPASIIITSQSDIELMPDAEGIRGLVRQLTPTTMRSDADRVALAYRLDGTEGTFEASRRFLPRRVDAALAVQADIDESDMLVRETIRFDVAHVPLEFVTLVVPAPVLESGTLEVRQNGLLLNPDESIGSENATGPEPETATVRPSPQTVRVQAILATPLLGAGEVTVQYELPTPTVAPESTVAEELPMVLPAATRIGRQSITLTVPETLAIDVRGDAWKRDVATLGSIASRTWTTARSQETVPLAISARKRAPQGDTIVDAAWLQTTLYGDRREDIYRYAIISSADQITLAWPWRPAGTGVDRPSNAATEHAHDAAVEVRLNGQPVAQAAREDGRIVIELPRRAGRTAWLVELFATRNRHVPLDMPLGGLAAASGMPAVVTLQAPRFPAGTLERRFYWELLLEPHEHPIGHPAGWTSQQRWTWGTFGLHLEPVVARDVLAEWLSSNCAGAVEQPGSVARLSADGRGLPATRPTVDVPAVGQRLVYSGVGSPDSGRIWVVPTWLLVLSVSGPMLAGGLLGLYLPSLQTVPVGLGLAVMAGLAAAAFPETAPLVVQAAMPGASLVALAAAMRFLLGGRSPSPPPWSAPAVVSASSMTQVAPQPSLIINPPSTADRTAAPARGRDLP